MIYVKNNQSLEDDEEFEDLNGSIDEEPE